MLINKTDNRSLKDSANDLDIIIKDQSISVSYAKTTKLITALYMVTDIIDKDEPLKNKLRTLGTEIISDMYSAPSNALAKISQIRSFLDIASAVNTISEMNAGILKKEFFELHQSITESYNNLGILTQKKNQKINLFEFFQEETSLPDFTPNRQHIGVQKGSTLMKALSKVSMSDRNIVSDRKSTLEFEVLKRQRREEIIAIIKISLNGATIKDIKTKASGALVSCGEKTLQRELVSMDKNGILNKTGDKRWSRYFVKI